MFFTLTLGDSYFPFLAYSYFPITLQPGKSHERVLNGLTGVTMKRLQYSVFFGEWESNGGIKSTNKRGGMYFVKTDQFSDANSLDYD